MGFRSVFCAGCFFVCGISLIPLVPIGINCLSDLIAADCAHLLTASVFCAGCFLCNYPLAVYMITCTARISRCISARISRCTCPGQQDACARILRKACVHKPVGTGIICKQFHVRRQIDGSLDHRDRTVKYTVCVCKRRKLPTTEVQFKHISAVVEHIGNRSHLLCIEPRYIQDGELSAVEEHIPHINNISCVKTTHIQ